MISINVRRDITARIPGAIYTGGGWHRVYVSPNWGKKSWKNDWWFVLHRNAFFGRLTHTVMYAGHEL